MGRVAVIERTMLYLHNRIGSHSIPARHATKRKDLGRYSDLHLPYHDYTDHRTKRMDRNPVVIEGDGRPRFSVSYEKTESSLFSRLPVPSSANPSST